MRKAEVYYRDIKAGLLTEDENGYSSVMIRRIWLRKMPNLLV